MRYIASSIVAASALTLASLLASTATHAQSAARCADLAGLKIAPAEIGLPSGGGAISSAQMQTVPADPKTPGATREFCKVLGAIAPVDPNAPPVNFQVNLPLQWNGKAVQYGGGGFNGVLITGLAPLRDARSDTPVPVARGFATWGTDSGHEAAKLAEPPAFALNDEALTNYAYAAYKKTRDAGRRIAMQFYGTLPSRIYFFGGSEGGREGLMMAQRFPNDFDGIVSAVPAINFMGTIAAEIKTGIAQQNGGWLNPAKVTALRMAVSSACDAADELADGVIGVYEKCVGVFDPKALRCANGADTGNDCLSDAQIAAVETLHHPTLLPFALANGLTSYPGWNYGSEDQAGGMVQYVTGLRPARFPDPTPEGQGIHWSHGNGGARYFIARDATFDPFTFSPPNFSSRMRQLSEMLDATDPDLSAFLTRNGKLILKANGADFALSPFQVINYYKSVVATLGQARVDQFIRFYVTPGVNHQGNGVLSSGDTVPAKVDLLGALDSWADTGEAPETLVQVSQEANAPFNVTASRPMCRYPLYPRYNGRGDPKQASSFTCTPQ
jgi:feruloyl esterase